MITKSTKGYNVKKINFDKFKKLMNKSQSEGIVMLGVGGDLQDWINGISNMLINKKISKGTVQELFYDLFELTTTGGRTDFAMIFNKEGNHNIEMMAIWKLKMGDISWVSDYLNNYKDQHYIY